MAFEKIEELETPSVLIDLAIMERNIAAMQRRCNALGINFRPHIKTHKIPEIARRQLDEIEVLIELVDHHMLLRSKALLLLKQGSCLQPIIVRKVLFTYYIGGVSSWRESAPIFDTYSGAFCREG